MSFQSPKTQKSGMSGHAANPPTENEEDLPDPFDELCHAKLSLMAEKTANRFVMKELLTQITLINDLFYRKQVQQEMILNTDSQVQLKSFVELSLSSSPNEIMLNATLHKQVVEEMRNKSNKQVSDEIRQNCTTVLKRFNDFMKGEREILNNLAKEKERNSFLEQELSKKEYRSILSPQQILRSERSESQNDLIQRIEIMSLDQEEAANYINELESQLQECRQELLHTKMEISDYKVDNISLNQQVASAEDQIRNLLEDSRKFEQVFDTMRIQIESLEHEKTMQLKNQNKMKELFAKAMQNLQEKQDKAEEEMSQPFTSEQVQAVINQSQINFNPKSKDQKQEMQRYIENLNRQIVEFQKNKSSLELVEQNLLHKVDQKQAENSELKALVNDIRIQLDLKSEAIGKAQKIIEKLTQKSDIDEALIERSQEEIEKFRKEMNAKQQKIKDLTFQLDEIQRKSHHQQNQMGETLNRELQELKGAIKGYQEELQVEKENYANQISLINRELAQTTEDRDEWSRRVRDLEIEIDRVIKEKIASIRMVEDQARSAQVKNKEREEEMRAQLEQKQAEAQSQIQYLQRRIKEIVDEASQLPNQTQPKQTEGNFLLQNSLKKELDALGSEVIALRQVLRQEVKKENSILNQKLSRFDEFRLKVLDQLIVWDQKSSELASVADRYYSYLEEQRNMFLKLKLIVTEKEKVIEQLKKQLMLREQSHDSVFNSLKAELHLQNRVMREEMLQTIKMLEKKCDIKERSCISLEDRMEAFKKEFTQLLEDKDCTDSKYQKMKQDLEHVEQSYLNLKAGSLRQNDKLAEIMGLNEQSSVVADYIIERSLRSLVVEHKQKFDENQRLRDEIVLLERSRAEEKHSLTNLIDKLEQEFSEYRTDSVTREEQIRAKFQSKEKKITQELESAEAYAEKVSSEAQVRERQIKKIQLKRQEDIKRFDELNASLGKLSREKQEVVQEKERIEAKISEHQHMVEEMLNKCEQAKHMYEMVKEDLNREKNRVKEMENVIKDQLRLITQEQNNVERARDQFKQLDIKVQALEKRSDHQQKDCNDFASRATEAQQERDKALIQVKQLQKEIQKANADLVLVRSDLSFYQQEIKQFENTVLRLTRDLDEERGKEEVIEELQRNLQTFDQQIDHQATEIIQLQDQLKGPKRSHVVVQTEDSGMIELQYARQEILKCQLAGDELHLEVCQLREALQRSNFEVCRLIEDKRELEDLIEKLNQSINFHRQNSQVNLASYREPSGRETSPQVQSNRKSPFRQTMPQFTSELVSGNQMHLIFHEKDNYINQLEDEINQMRREIEQQRENIIHLDLNSMGTDTNRHGLESGLTSCHNPGTFRHQQQFFRDDVQSRINPYVKSHDERDQRSVNENINPNASHLSSFNAEIPIRLNPQTMNYSTLSRTLTGHNNLAENNYQIIEGSIAEANEDLQAYTSQKKILRSNLNPNASFYGSEQYFKHK